MTRVRRRPFACLLARAGLAALFFSPAGALVAQSPARDVAHLGLEPEGRMHALLERTLLRIDVLTLDICFDSETAEAMARTLAISEGSNEKEVEDAVVRAALGADEALAVLEFKREIGLEQFLEGIAEDHDRAVRAGLLADSTRIALSRILPDWYAFLGERRIREGDRIYYRFTPDAVRATYLGVEGDVFLDKVSVGAERRASILGAYFAPGASLRDDLLDSLLRGKGDRTRTLSQCGTAGTLPPTLGDPA